MSDVLGAGVTQLDLTKFAIAVGAGTTSLAAAQLQAGYQPGSLGADLVAPMLVAAYRDLVEILDGDFEFYDSGRPVWSLVEPHPDCACTWMMVWHPDPQHPRNAPREVAVLECERGGRHHLMVTAPGEIEVDAAELG